MPDERSYQLIGPWPSFHSQRFSRVLLFSDTGTAIAPANRARRETAEICMVKEKVVEVVVLRLMELGQGVMDNKLCSYIYLNTKL